MNMSIAPEGDGSCHIEVTGDAPVVGALFQALITGSDISALCDQFADDASKLRTLQGFVFTGPVDEIRADIARLEPLLRFRVKPVWKRQTNN